jgi:hypothetical protein
VQICEKINFCLPPHIGFVDNKVSPSKIIQVEIKEFRDEDRNKPSLRNKRLVGRQIGCSENRNNICHEVENLTGPVPSE